MYTELDAWEKYQQDILKGPKENTTSLATIENQRTLATGLEQHSIHIKHLTVLTLSIQLIKLQTHLILNYSNSSKRELQEERDKDKEDIEKNKYTLPSSSSVQSVTIACPAILMHLNILESLFSTSVAGPV